MYTHTHIYICTRAHTHTHTHTHTHGFPGGSDDKEYAYNAGDLCSISGSG